MCGLSAATSGRALSPIDENIFFERDYAGRVTESETRIAFYLPSFERGGIERFLINIGGELVDRGVTVDVLVRTTTPTVEQLDDRVNVVRMGATSVADTIAQTLLHDQVAKAVLSFPSYVRYLVREVPDLLVSMQLNPFAVIGVRLARVDIPVVIRESNMPSAASPDRDSPLSRLSPLAKRIFYPRADRVIANSEDVADEIVQFVDVPPEQVGVIYNPTFAPSVFERATEPVSHPWFESDVPVIVSVGRFAKQKDFETLIRAFAILVETHEARLLLVGDGEERSKLESLTETLGIADSVGFTGYQENPYKYMSRAEVFVLSSNYEGLPNVLIEAIAVATPAVSSDCPGGADEILVDGNGGKLVSVGNADAMASAIADLLDNPSHARNELAIAYDHIDRFTPDHASEAYIKLAEEL